MPPRSATPNSRESLQGAGWTCPAGRFRAFVPDKRPLSWLQPRMLWEARNDRVARIAGDPVNDLRRAWMRAVSASAQGNGARDPRLIDRTGGGDVSFMVIGDPGEGDASQWATIPPLEATWGDTDFIAIMSDVNYPAGNVNEYEEKFYRPYRDYPAPIYGIPGNHDWYDELRGFMFHLCRLDDMAPPEFTYDRGQPAWKREVHRRLWRRPDPPDTAQASVRDQWRSLPGQRSGQRTPYWTIETDPVRIVGIDTGILGGLDREQGEWLREVSRDPGRAKILLTGKPLYVDGKYHPCPIEGGGTVDEIVRDADAGYIAAIGGDIHNYQRYPVKLDDGRTLQYVVAGGGGAFMHPTHDIPRVRLPGVDEDAFLCYPRRGDSLALFSRLYDRKLAFGRGYFEISPDEAAAYLSERLGIEPVRRGRGEVVLSDRARRAAMRLAPLPGRAHGALHSMLALWFDINEPPMFKSFLRIDASADRVRVRCFAATGCRDQQDDPPVEDELVAEPDEAGGWAWTEALERA
jgi:calcineurin-like phosphoesterase family protein